MCNEREILSKEKFDTKTKKRNSREEQLAEALRRNLKKRKSKKNDREPT